MYGGGNIKKLVDYIENAKYYEKEFLEWEAFEQIIDEDKAFWMLKKPGSRCQRVCLYRDGYNMFVYGDYGQFTFDSMTWIGNVYNLEYDNIGYQMEKLNYENRKSLIMFDECKCRKDIINWLRHQLEEYYENDKDIEKIINLLMNMNCMIFVVIKIRFLTLKIFCYLQKNALRMRKNMSGYHFLEEIITSFMILVTIHVRAGYGMQENVFIRDILFVCMHCKFVVRN